MSIGVSESGKHVFQRKPPEYYEGEIDRKKFPYKSAEEFFEQPPDHFPRAYEYGRTPEEELIYMAERLQKREEGLKERETKFQITNTSDYFGASPTESNLTKEHIIEWGVNLHQREEHIKQKELEVKREIASKTDRVGCSGKDITCIAIPLIVLIGTLLAIILPLYYWRII